VEGARDALPSERHPSVPLTRDDERAKLALKTLIEMLQARDPETGKWLPRAGEVLAEVLKGLRTWSSRLRGGGVGWKLRENMMRNWKLARLASRI
jgi:hypothetical protein